jgi:hypothetical protein
MQVPHARVAHLILPLSLQIDTPLNTSGVHIHDRVHPHILSLSLCVCLCVCVCPVMGQKTVAERTKGVLTGCGIDPLRGSRELVGSCKGKARKSCVIPCGIVLPDFARCLCDQTGTIQPIWTSCSLSLSSLSLFRSSLSPLHLSPSPCALRTNGDGQVLKKETVNKNDPTKAAHAFLPGARLHNCFLVFCLQRTKAAPTKARSPK